MNRTLSPMNWMGVFSSCATPAASWPIDSSFCAWASCASRSRRSVVSAPSSRMPAGWPRPARIVASVIPR